MTPPQMPRHGTPLTPPELAVLAGLADGLNSDEIGTRLVLSGHTVRSHAARLRAKLGAYTRAHAVRIAFDRGLLVPAGQETALVDAVLDTLPAPVTPEQFRAVYALAGGGEQP